MPIQTTNFPTKQFDAQFTESSADVRQYFTWAWGISGRVAGYIAENTPPSKGRRKTRRRLSLAKIYGAVMHETGAKRSSVYDARQCGDAFDEADVEHILALCKDAGLLPSRRLFLELMRVPADDRDSFAEEVIGDKCGKEEIQLRRQEQFGKQAKGSKVPHAPRSQFELTSQMALHRARLNSLFGWIAPPPVRGKRPPCKLGFEVPEDVDSDIRMVMRGMKSLEEKCRQMLSEDSAA